LQGAIVEQPADAHGLQIGPTSDQGTNDVSKAVTKPDEAEELDPIEAACLPKERAFVAALLSMPEPNAAEAARLAGYGVDGSTAETYAKIAYRLQRRDRVLELLKHETKKVIRTLAPTALQTLKQIMTSSSHKDQLRASLSVLDRIDPLETKHSVEVTHKIDHQAEELAHYRKLVTEGAPRAVFIFMFGANGLERIEALVAKEDQAKLPPPGEIIDVTPNVMPEPDDTVPEVW
jgi:hypothetical protein